MDGIKKDAVCYDSSVPKVRKIESDIDNLIESGQLKAGFKREWEQRKEDIRTVLREEVDDVRADSVKARDEEWRRFLEQNYVEKKVAQDLDNDVKTRDASIKNLMIKIAEKDEVIKNNQQDMSQIKATHYFEKERINDQVRGLIKENNFLEDETARLHNYIENRLDVDVRQWQEQVCHDQEVLNGKIIKFDRYVKAKQSKLEEFNSEIVKELKDVQRREKELAEKEEKLRKREDEFDKRINQLFDILKEWIKAIEKREKNVAELEKRYKR